MSGATVLPVVEATRRPPRTFIDPPMWCLRCPYCHRRHVHAAGPEVGEIVLPSRRGGGTRFYRVREVSGGRS